MIFGVGGDFWSILDGSGVLLMLLKAYGYDLRGKRSALASSGHL